MNKYRMGTLQNLHTSKSESFFLLGHLKNIMYTAPVGSKKALHILDVWDYSKLPWHLKTDVLVPEEMLQGMHWIWNTF